MIISTNDIAFKSYDVKANHKSKDEILKEHISFDKELQQTNQLENITYHTTTNNNESLPTIFKDPTNNKYVITSMTIEVLDRLKKQFGEDDIISKKDGTVQLRDKAEAFVSGWFADIAYTREFLKSDQDNNGILSDKEILSVKNSLEIEINKDSKSNVTISKSYTTINEEKLEVTKIIFPNMPISLDDELNMTLKFDYNFDGNISLGEVIMSFNEAVGTVPLEDIENLHTNNFDLSMDDMDKLFSIMEYIRKLFLNMKLEKEIIKVIDNSILTKELKPEQINKILTEELFEFITQKDDTTKNKKQNNNSINIKQQEKISNNNINAIKELI